MANEANSANPRRSSLGSTLRKVVLKLTKEDLLSSLANLAVSLEILIKKMMTAATAPMGRLM